MEFFIDTANIEEIKKASEWGFIDGVTTNPSLMAKTGRTESVIREIAEIIQGPISAEVVATTYAEMIKEGTALAQIHRNIVVKLPLTEDGIKACKHFSTNNIILEISFKNNPLILAKVNIGKCQRYSEYEMRPILTNNFAERILYIN